MLYLKKKNLLFIHNAKCAGQYVSHLLGKHMSQDDIHIGGTNLGEMMQNYYIHKYNVNKHSSIGEVVKSDLNIGINFFSFATVRDPVDRVISAYRYLMGVPKEYWNSHFIDDVRRLSLFEFIETKYLGWLPSQYSKVSVGGFITVDKICKVEEFPDSLSFLNNFGISVNIKEKINQSSYGNKDKLLEQLLNSPKHLNIIYGKYMYDYVNFGYERR